MITLRKVTYENADAVVALSVQEEQQHFVASNAYSLAQAYVQPECVPLAIYSDEQPVGFVMYCMDRDDNEYWIYRLMIDKAYQGKGYGRAAMEQVINIIKQDTGHHILYISFEPENAIAKALYESLGFVSDNRMGGGEVIYRLTYGEEHPDIKPEIALKKVESDEREILMNLLEKYDYEFSQYDKRDVNKLGLYGFQWMDYYFTQPNRYSFFILVDGKLAGFVMISDYPEAEGIATDYALSEFFVMHKYRRMGVGSYAAKAVFDMYHGRWQLRRHPHNLPSVAFWDKVVSEYTNGNYRIERAYSGALYDDGTPSDIFFFEN